jgi:hypothetical protein
MVKREGRGHLRDLRRDEGVEGGAGLAQAMVSPSGSGAVTALSDSSSITAWPQNGTWTSE